MRSASIRSVLLRGGFHNASGGRPDRARVEWSERALFAFPRALMVLVALMCQMARCPRG
jgi:hypothetical protein